MGEIRIEFDPQRADFKINLWEVIDHFDAEQKRELTARLAWDDDILNEIVDGLTTEYASRSYDSHIHEARKRIVARLDKLIDRLVQALVEEAARERSSADLYRNYAIQVIQNYDDRVICRHCGEATSRQPPRLPQWHASERATEPAISQIITEFRAKFGTGGGEDAAV